MKKLLLMVVAIAALTTSASAWFESSQTDKDKRTVERQQKQYAKGQPVPAYNWSLERDLLIKLYNLRNQKVSTHSVWRSDYGMVEGDCTSMGYGLPYDTSLTNPLKEQYVGQGSAVALGQAEPNGVFASTNTAATWVMCISESGSIEPHYVESKVTVYPYSVKVDYDTNRVTKSGSTTATLK